MTLYDSTPLNNRIIYEFQLSEIGKGPKMSTSTSLIGPSAGRMKIGALVLFFRVFFVAQSKCLLHQLSISA